MRGCPSQSRRQADATAPPEGGAKSDGICGEGGECIYPHQYAAEQCSALRAPPFRQGGLRRGAKGDASSVIRLAGDGGCHLPLEGKAWGGVRSMVGCASSG